MIQPNNLFTSGSTKITQNEIIHVAKYEDNELTSTRHRESASLSPQKPKNTVGLEPKNCRLVLKQKVRPIPQHCQYRLGGEMALSANSPTKKRDTLSILPIKLNTDDDQKENSVSQGEQIKRSKSILKQRRTLNSESNLLLSSKNVKFGSEVVPILEIIPIQSYRNYNCETEDNKAIKKANDKQNIECGCSIF